jgi:hypothetical protein
MRCARLLVLAWPVWCAGALRPIDVGELESIVQAAGHADDETARYLAGSQLSERLTDEALTRLLRESPGPRTSGALQSLAAESAFLSAPEAEWPLQERPAIPEQRAIIDRAVEYATGYVRSLPDFLCTIETHRFDDAPRPGDKTAPWGRFHPRDTIVSELTFESARESYAVRTVNGHPPRDNKPIGGLTTWGEFGPQMAELLLGKSGAGFRWNHVETLDGKRVAVFDYSVDAAHSRYVVSWCCGKALVAYRGQVFINPDSGAVVRLTREAVGLPADSGMAAVRTAVDYRLVEIGGRPYMCPSRSIAAWYEVTHSEREQPMIGRSGLEDKWGLAAVTYLNEVLFREYRKFGAEVKMLTDGPAAEKGAEGAPLPAGSGDKPLR